MSVYMCVLTKLGLEPIHPYSASWESLDYVMNA